MAKLINGSQVNGIMYSKPTSYTFKNITAAGYMTTASNLISCTIMLPFILNADDVKLYDFSMSFQARSNGGYPLLDYNTGKESCAINKETGSTSDLTTALKDYTFYSYKYGTKDIFGKKMFFKKQKDNSSTEDLKVYIDATIYADHFNIAFYCGDDSSTGSYYSKNFVSDKFEFNNHPITFCIQELSLDFSYNSNINASNSNEDSDTSEAIDSNTNPEEE